MRAFKIFVHRFTVVELTNHTCNSRFEELYGGGQPVDRVRQQHLPKQGPTLDYLGMLLSLVNSPGLISLI